MQLRITALFVLALVLTFGCQQQQEQTSPATADTARTTAGETATKHEHCICPEGHAKDVVVFVELEGTNVNVTPEEAYLHCPGQKIKWYTNGPELKIVFKPENEKKLTDPPCEKQNGKVPSCGDGWDKAVNGRYKYTAQVIVSEKVKYEKDPEVVIER